MTITRLEGVRTILFDAGNTLVFVDLARVGRTLAAAGHPRPPEDLSPAEAEARLDMYRHFDAHPESSDEERWSVYVDGMLRRIGLDRAADHDAIVEALHAANRAENLWKRVPDGTGETLAALAARGFRLGVVSNADGRVPDLLEEVGLAVHFETIVDSHLVGVEKPDPEIFAIALRRLDETPEATVYVGDFPAVDVVGARRAGIRPILLDPLGAFGGDGVVTIGEFGELGAVVPELAAGRR